MIKKAASRNYTIVEVILPQPVSPTIRVTRFSIIFSTILLRSDMIGRLLKFSIDEDEEDDDDSKAEEVDDTTIAKKNPRRSAQSSLCEIGRKIP